MPTVGPIVRVLIAAGWITGQLVLVATGSRREDHSFAFQMFPEASTIEIHIFRLTAEGLVAAPGGEWAARDPSGQLQHFSFHDRVHDPILGRLDTRVFASYGVDTQLARLRHALDDVVRHVPDDAETLRLRADVIVSRNGREVSTVTLLSRPKRTD
ncbi:MAG: hypothetical protein ABSC94_12000 [Polyangiaceae bacterium]